MDFRFQIYTKLSYLTNNSHESFFCANILTVDTSVYANNVTVRVIRTEADTNPEGYGVPP